MEGVFEWEVELGSDVRSASTGGGCGDRDGRDIWEGEREDGNDEREVLRLTALPAELLVPFVDGRYRTACWATWTDAMN